MNLNYSADQINEWILQNEKIKRVFYQEIHPRFSDCIYNRKIHFSKYFEFFEMARFEIMLLFYDYLKEKKTSDAPPSLGNFVVVRASFESYPDLGLPVNGFVKIKTAFIIHHKPLLEFEQTAFTKSGNPCVKANIKIAIVNEKFEKIENWERDILGAMLAFTNQYGKEETA